jgi:ribosomal protein S25
MFVQLGGNMVLVESIREILRSEEEITPRELSQRLDIRLEMAIDILKELRRG